MMHIGHEYSNHGLEDSVSADFNEIGNFIQWLHAQANRLQGELVLLALEQRPTHEHPLRRIRRFSIGATEDMMEFALREVEKDWVNLYFSSYVARPGLAAGARGTHDDIVAVLMLGVDQDADTGREGTLPLEPNLVIQTSHTPTVNRQSFYVFDPLNRPSVEEAHHVGEALRRVTGADSGPGDIARVFRVPGTLNWPTPTKIKRGRPYSPQLVLIERPASGYFDLSTFRDKLESSAGNESTTWSHAGNATSEPGALLKRASAALKKMLKVHDKDGDRSSAAYAAIMTAMREGFTDRELAALVHAHKDGVGERYLGIPGGGLLEDILRIRTKYSAEARECEQALESGQQACLPSGFARDADGDLVRADRTKGELHKICSAIEVTARIRDKNSLGWGLVVRIIDPDRQEKQIIVPWRDLNVTSGERDPVGKLRDQGLQLYASSAAVDVREFLTKSVPTAIARSIDRTGWQNGSVFALPNRIFGSSGDQLLWAGEPTDATLYECAGTLAEWQSKVAQPAAVHPLLVAALCHGLVGPMLELCDADGFGVHLFGKSSSGKTTAAELGASIWAPPEVFLKSWRTTVNGLEGVAAAQNEILLVLDELKQASPDDVAQALYMISQGKGKQRAGRSGQARIAKTWNVPYLSTGEISIPDYVNSAFATKATAGQQVRCLDIRVPADTGIFRTGSKPEENAALASRLKAVAHEFHGTAGPAFLEHVVKARDETKSTAHSLRKVFENNPGVKKLLGSNPDGQVLRVRDQISIIYATGCLASKWSVLPFSEDQVRTAALLLLELWINERGGVEAHEDHEAVEAIRGFIQTNQHRLMRPTLCNDPNGDSDAKWITPPKPIGYCLEEGRLFAIFQQTWKNEACAGLDSKQVAERLFAAGYLQPEMSKGKMSKPAKKVTVGEERQRLVCISADILTIKDEEHEHDGTLKSFIRSEDN
jgi:putative DNA primase/helicase